MEDDKGSSNDRPEAMTRKGPSGLEEVFSRPFGFLDDLFGDVSAIFSDEQRPHYRLEDKQDHYALRIDVPGVPKEKIDLQYDPRTTVLELHAAHETSTQEEGTRHVTSRSYSWAHAIPDVDHDRISATYENGVLIATLPKRAPEPMAAAKRITISDATDNRN